MRYCDRCGHRRAEHRASDLPDIVAQDFERVCADCLTALKAEAELLGVAS